MMMVNQPAIAYCFTTNVRLAHSKQIKLQFFYKTVKLLQIFSLNFLVLFSLEHPDVRFLSLTEVVRQAMLTSYDS
jgi:hypothetical protein